MHHTLFCRPFPSLSTGAALLLATLGSTRAALAVQQAPDPGAAPPLSVAITPAHPGLRWELKIENQSQVPVRVADDMRLLSLELKPSGSDKASTCALPSDTLPKDGTAITRKTLKPGESFVRSFDPAFYCFGSAKQALFERAASVTPHFGFHAPAETANAAPPFVALPSGSSDLLPLKAVTGDTVAIEQGHSDTSSESEASDVRGRDFAPELRMVKGSDAGTERSVVVAVRLSNPTSSSMVVYFRRALLGFEVSGHGETIRCEPQEESRNPTLRAFTRLSPQSSVTLESRLVELCPRGTFAEPGVYSVRADFETDASGADVGLRAFTGSVRADAPVLVRVRHGIRLVSSDRTKTSTGAVTREAPRAAKRRP
jgi:hypothetical protein